MVSVRPQIELKNPYVYIIMPQVSQNIDLQGWQKVYCKIHFSQFSL